MEDPRDQRQEADVQQQERHVGVGQGVEQVLSERHPEGNDPSLRAQAGDTAALAGEQAGCWLSDEAACRPAHSCQELLRSWGDQVHHVQSQRILFARADGPSDGVLGPRGVAVPPVGQGPDERRRVVGDLVLLDGPGHPDRVGRSDVRPRCHGGDRA